MERLDLLRWQLVKQIPILDMLTNGIQFVVKYARHVQ